MRSVQVTIYARVYFDDDELDEFRESALANGDTYEVENDAIYALALSKMPDIDGHGVKERDTVVDLSTISNQ